MFLINENQTKKCILLSKMVQGSGCLQEMEYYALLIFKAGK